jgi:uncharacterized membrane protein YeaQ/YmgE (transglycosylase-associated protein family)
VEKTIVDVRNSEAFSEPKPTYLSTSRPERRIAYGIQFDSLKAAPIMRTTDPLVVLLIILIIGVVAGLLYDRLAGPSWLARQFTGSNRGIVTSALVGVAGAFVGHHVAILLALGGGLITSVIAAAIGAAAVLFAWRMVR